MTLRVVVEGDTDLPFVRKLAAGAGLEIEREFDMNGKDQIDLQFPAFNGAAKGSPWLVVRDLDHDAPCPVTFMEAREIVPGRWMSYRIAMREVEAWALADVEGMADFLGIRQSLLPSDPDSEDDPTRTLVRLCKESRKRRIRDGMVPAPGARAVVGPLYEALLIEFGTKHWDLDRATRRSESLSRARVRLGELAARWDHYSGGTS